MQSLLRILLAVLGTAVIGISLLHISLGPAAIPGSIPVNATMDSEDRFYATMFLAYGAACLWCARDLRARSRAVQLLSLMLFLGGIARVVSMIAVGLPSAFFLAMAGVELLLHPLLAWLAVRRL